MTVKPVDLEGKRLLITGATGFVAQPIIAALAHSSEVFAAARYQKSEQKTSMRALGATPVVVDLASSDFSQLPDVDYVLNLAVAKSGKWRTDLAINAENLGHLMQRYQNVAAFLHVSSTAVYAYSDHQAKDEYAALGDNHKHLFETYSISKIAAESVARFAAKTFDIPLTIARLNVPYGNFPCWPYFHLMMMQNGMPIDIHPDQPNGYSPIHADDYIAKIPYLLAAASCDTTLVNLAGDEVVSIEQWCEYMSELTGLPVSFNKTEQALGNLSVNTTRQTELSGACHMPWQRGIKSMIETLAPDLLQTHA